MRYTNWRGIFALLAAATCLWAIMPGIVLRAQSPAWSEPVSLSRTFPTSYLPDIAADRAGNLYVVWDAQFTERDEGWADGIGFAMWDGSSWTEAVDILVRDIYHLPSIAVDSTGKLHVFGVGAVGLGYSWAWAQHRPTSARAWSTPVDVSGDLPRVYWNDVVVDSRDRIHVVFSDQAPATVRQIVDGQCIGDDCSWVFYTYSADGGDNWSEPVKISPAMASGARVMIAADAGDNLYVTWSTESYGSGATFTPSTNGFTYHLEGDLDWSEPETEIVDAGDTESSPDYWLSVAVDSQRTVHLIANGPGFRHLHKSDLAGAWIEEPVPSPGVRGGYGFRGIAVDSADRLHVVFPSFGPTRNEATPGLFHASWDRNTGWSQWSRATTNARGKGCGLGNVVISGGNQLHVVWFEHLEGSGGHLFATPRGRIEIYHAHMLTYSGARVSTPLPTVPLAVLSPEFPAVTSPEPVATTLSPTVSPSFSGTGDFVASESITTKPVMWGVLLTAAIMGLAVAWQALVRKRR